MDHEFYDLFDNFSITKHQITEATSTFRKGAKEKKKFGFQKQRLCQHRKNKKV